MSDIELGSVISLIMENPDLIREIKRLAERKQEVSQPESTAITAQIPEKPDEIVEKTVAISKPTPEEKIRSRGKRSELLHALSPYISEDRQKALETFMTIADILDMMREK